MEAGTGVPGVGVTENTEFPNMDPVGVPPDVLGNSSSGISGPGAKGAGVPGIGAPRTGAITGTTGAPGATASGPREFWEFKKAGLNGVWPEWSTNGGPGPGVTGSKTNPGTAGTVPGNVVVSGNIVTGEPAGEFRKFGANDNEGVG